MELFRMSGGFNHREAQNEATTCHFLTYPTFLCRLLPFLTTVISSNRCGVLAEVYEGPYIRYVS